MIRANTQPNQNTKIAGGGICDGLIFATTGGQSTGYIDFVSGLLPSSMSGAATAINANGASARPAASSGVISWPAGSTGLDKLSGPGTLLVCMRSNNNAGNWRAFGSREDSSTGDGVYLLYDDNANVTNGFNCGGNNNNYRANSNSNALGTNSEQSFHAFGFTWDGAGCQTYADGKPDKLTTGGNAAFAPNANSGRVTRIASGTAAADFLWAYAWNRVLSAAEVASITANPWQIFALPDRRNLADAGAGGGTITGTLAQTLANSALAASGSVSVNGSASSTLAASTVAASAALAISSTLSQTLSASTLSGAGTVSSGSTGVLAQTLAGSTVSASGAVQISALSAATLAASTLASAATNGSNASLAQTLSASTLAASGSVVAAGGIVGALAQTLANSTAIGAGSVTVQGVLAQTLVNATLAAVGSGGAAAPASVADYDRWLLAAPGYRALIVEAESRLLISEAA